MESRTEMIALHQSQTTPIGLHLGVQSAVLAQLVRRGSGYSVHAVAFGELPHDEDQPADEQDRRVAEVLEKLVQQNGFKGRDVITCLGGQELFVQNVRLPQLPADEVEKVIRWEAEERLPYPIAEAEIRHLIAGEVRQDAALKQEVILLACHQGVIGRQMRVLEHAGLTPVCIDAEPCAVLRCLRSRADDRGARRAYLCFGERTTSVILAEDQQILFLKYISSGGHHLDRAVAKHLDLSVGEAARLREKVATERELDTSDEIHRSVIEAIRGPLETIAAEIELCLRYYKVTFRGRPLDGVVLTGAEGSPWLAEFLTQRLGLPCALGAPFGGLAAAKGPGGARQRAGLWTTAIGLALPVGRSTASRTSSEKAVTA